MISEYISNFLNVIENMHNENTYKLAWGRAILELIHEMKLDKNQDVIITTDMISLKMLKYYWNQQFFFNLKQSPNDKKSPIICRITNSLITDYKNLTNSNIPIWFDKAQAFFKKNNDAYQKALKKIANILPNDVSWRFKIINGKELPLYKYDYVNRSKEIIFRYVDAIELKEYSFLLSRLLNYKWAQLLEKFNYVPKIASKVNGISKQKLRRNNLTKYKNELLKQHNGKAIDFYTEKEILASDISVDHVIPWSFMYSDDIWNLVLTSKGNNSSKSNSIPPLEIIEKLNKRNKELSSMLSGKYKQDLEEALLNDYLNKYYYECRL